MKASVYLRVSTTEQSTDNQRPALEAYAESRGWEVTAIYAENESAWKAGHQTELKHLIADARQQKFGIVLVWSLDRLSREGSAAILNLINTLKLYQVKVISYQESWTEAPGELGELLFALAGWVARMESQRRSERTKAGLVRAISQGKTLGRPSGTKDKKRRKKRSARIYA